MSRALPRRMELAAGFTRRNRVARALAFFVALLVLFVSLQAEAKKKKPASHGKKHKTPATKSKGKAAPEAAPESEEAGEEKSSSSEKGDEEEEKAASKPTPAPEPVGEEEGAPKKPAKSKPAPEPSEGGGGGGAPFALKIGVGGRALFRQLRWTDDMNALAPYTLSPGP